MARFYLNLCNGTGFVEDEEGVELPDLEAARAKAVEGLRDIVAGEIRQGELNMGAFISIEDEARRAVGQVSFSEAVRVSSKHAQGRNG
jgi:hypothetical protein